MCTKTTRAGYGIANLRAARKTRTREMSHACRPTKCFRLSAMCTNTTRAGYAEANSRSEQRRGHGTRHAGADRKPSSGCRSCALFIEMPTHGLQHRQNKKENKHTGADQQRDSGCRSCARRRQGLFIEMPTHDLQQRQKQKREEAHACRTTNCFRVGRVHDDDKG